MILKNKRAKYGNRIIRLGIKKTISNCLRLQRLLGQRQGYKRKIDPLKIIQK